MTTRLEQVVEIRRMYKNGVSKANIMRKLNLSRPTVDKYINEDNFNDSHLFRNPKRFPALPSWILSRRPLMGIWLMM